MQQILRVVRFSAPTEKVHTDFVFLLYIYISIFFTKLSLRILAERMNAIKIYMIKTGFEQRRSDAALSKLN